MSTDASLSTLYEILVRDIYQAVVDQALVETVEVLHDVEIEGRSGEKHQIDVYWEFRQAGFTQRVCIEVKAYKNRAKKDHVSAFYGKVKDIGDDVRGVFVCLAGFQSGAIGLAKFHGIALQTAHWILRRVKIDFTLAAHPLDHVTDVEVVLDKPVVRDLLRQAGVERIHFRQHLKTDSQFLWPTSGGEAVDLSALLEDPSKVAEGWHTLPAVGFALKHDEHGLLPLAEVKVNIRHPPPLMQQLEIKSPDDFVKAELRDVVHGWVKQLGVDGQLIVEE